MLEEMSVNMEILNAVLGDVSFSRKSRWDNKTLITQSKAHFRINGSMVNLTLPESYQPERIVLEKGDHVLLAGKFKKGIFNALAYKNVTKDVASKKPPIIGSLFGGVTFIGMGLFALFAAYSEIYTRDVSDDGLQVIVLAGLAFISAGLFLVWQAFRPLKAYTLLDDFSGM